jgi:NADH dehydrogenase [ubiquinone] 1 alpha subcomplex assembly factor 1
MSDADMGGYSSASLDYIPASSDTSEPAHARFHGSISTELPVNRPHIVRSGYAGFATHDRKPTLFGRGFWDIDPYTHLCLKVNSDGRKYYVNIRTDSIVATDIHQHRLTTKQPGKWETVVIDLKEFVRTNNGEVVEPQNEMLRESVKSVGVSLLDRIPRHFDLKIARVWVTNFRGDGEFDGRDPLKRPEDWENEGDLTARRRRRREGEDKILM